MRIFADRQVGQQHHLLAHSGQVVKGAHRHVNLVPDATTLNQQLRRIFFEQYSGKTTYHGGMALKS
jgi:hypothetical protein